MSTICAALIVVSHTGGFIVVSRTFGLVAKLLVLRGPSSIAQAVDACLSVADTGGSLGLLALLGSVQLQTTQTTQGHGSLCRSSCR